ncbi:Hint domain-containing protein [Ruegeria sp. Ofav3-42]|uniref:Hint domain-containing protein n=1 Tax=Ruegeria sp. Ofav3-42 TaxID=2917759 RepID=UPI001EF3EAC0|nr:Hint domain-containing protein [Ruegeria sp. Ofav3-42]MCG7520344.1 Hint domain-containing protein [Ruegeria sp. Ofav3-42]
MPTTYKDQFFELDPANPGNNGTVVGTPLTVQSLDIVDQNDDGLINRLNDDSVDGSDITSTFFNDMVTIELSNGTQVTYSGVTFYLADGRRVFTPDGDQVLQNGTFVSSSFTDVSDSGDSFGSVDIGNGDLGPPCFTPGTLIDTPDGPRAVEDLKPGDQVLTADNGPRPLLWIGRTTVEATGKLAPIRFDAGVLGLSRPLVVSPQHRMLVEDWRAPFLFGHSEVLIAAHCLVNGDTVTRVEGGQVEYIHLLFSKHEIVTANGAKSESYYPGHAISQADKDVQAEVLRLFPELGRRRPTLPETARPVVRPREARAIVI